MEYTVQKLAKLAGISSRTLRYYDEIGILKPARINSSGYRIYGKQEVDKLQLIMFYRELAFNLETIRDIVNIPNFDEKAALKKHRLRLLEEKYRIETLLNNVEKTIAYKEEKIVMNDKEKFEGLKDKLLKENEKKFGDEIREKYDEDLVKKSNERFKNMTQEDFNLLNELASQVKYYLGEAFKHRNPASDLAQKAAELHKEWITLSWGTYDKEAHANLAQMYVDDERFKAYYDDKEKGSAEFLRDAIFIYTGRKDVDKTTNVSGCTNCDNSK